MACSTICHLVYVRSEKVQTAVSCLDYWGISALFLGSAYPYVGYNFACGPMIFYRYLFMTLLGICSGIIMVLTTLPKFFTPVWRSILFSSFALTFAGPILVHVVTHDPQYSLEPDLGPLFMNFCVFGVGACFYVSKCPERWLNGQVDYFRCGHNVFHVCVLLGLWINFRNSWTLYEHRLAFECSL